MHGKTSPIHHDGKLCLRDSQPLRGARYHSLVIDPPSVRTGKSAKTAEGEIMAIRRQNLAVEGCSFIRNRF
ncbi:MAG: hypothetical protein U1F57_08670 [bacterium]